MKQSEFENINNLEKNHWWYVGMREIWTSILPLITLKKKFHNILDIGCGTGGNLLSLEKFGNAEGLEYDDFAFKLCKKNHHTCFKGSILELHKIRKKYQLITVFDVLYQFDKEKVRNILSNIYNLLEIEGFLMIREPAFSLAFGKHDLEVGTKTRFVKKDFREMFENLGYELKFINYLNFFLFPPIVLKRKFDFLGDNRPNSDLKTSSNTTNKVLKKVLELEKEILMFLIKSFPNLCSSIFPFGVSIFLIAQRKK